jgi:hypothetical protein
MRKKILKRKRFIVDSQPYEVSMTAIYNDKIDLRVTLKAVFGYGSICAIVGLRNLDYYYNYGYWNEPNFSESTDTISVTPKMIELLIRFAHQSGWSPQSEKSNKRIAISNLKARELLTPDN